MSCLKPVVNIATFSLLSVQSVHIFRLFLLFAISPKFRVNRVQKGEGGGALFLQLQREAEHNPT